MVCGSAESLGMLGVPVVPGSPLRMGDLDFDSFPVSDCEFVVSQSFSFYRKRRAFLVESQGDMNAASSPEDVPPLSRGSSQEVDVGVNQRWAAVYSRKKDAALPGPK